MDSLIDRQIDLISLMDVYTDKLVNGQINKLWIMREKGGGAEE